MRDYLGPWLSGFAAKMQEVAARQSSGESLSWEPGWSDPITLLAVAFDQGPALRELLKAGADKNVKNENGRTALMLAAEKGYVGVVKALIENGANKNEIKEELPNIILLDLIGHTQEEVIEKLQEFKNLGIDVRQVDNAEGQSILHLAAEDGHIEVVNALIANKAEIEAKDEYERTPLMYAAENGHIEVVKALIAKEAEIEAKDGYERTPLMCAAENGHIEVVKFLIANEAEIEAEDEDERTPLMYAAENGHIEVVKFLIANGAEIEAKDVDEKTSLMYAAKNGRIEVVKFLIAKGANKDEIKKKLPKIILLDLIGHTQEKIIEKLQEFKDLGIDVRQVDNANSPSLLHLACKTLQGTKWSGEHANVLISSLISSLIKFGVDVNVKDSLERTPLFDAVSSETLTRELIRHGTDVNAVMQGGYTPIFMARDQHVLDLLVQNGARPNHKNDEGLTPLHFGIRIFNLRAEVFQGLIKVGATIDEEFRNKVIDVVRKAHLDRAEAVPEVEADAASWIQFFADEAALYGVKN